MRIAFRIGLWYNFGANANHSHLHSYLISARNANDSHLRLHTQNKVGTILARQKPCQPVPYISCLESSTDADLKHYKEFSFSYLKVLREFPFRYPHLLTPYAARNIPG